MSKPTVDNYEDDDKVSDEKIGVESFHSDAVRYDSGVDVAVKLVGGAHSGDAELSPEEFRRIRWKLDLHILPLLCLLYTLQYLDKSSIGASSILGIIADEHLDTNQYNNIGSAFYIGLLIFEYPHNLAFQRFPVAKYLTLNIFIWSLLIGLQATTHSYGGLFTIRLLLGASEGAVTTSLMIITNMYYTRVEIGERIAWAFMCNGLAQVISGFIAFGTYHANPHASPNQWQWLMVAISLMTFITGLLFLFFFPDNPTTARFLSEEDKVKVIKRIQGNMNGIETKVWKKSQFIEALKDPKTWLFFFMAVIADLQNGILVQYSLIIESFGFTTLETTLLNMPSGFGQIIGVTLLTIILRQFPNSRSYVAILGFIPSFLGAILQIALPWKNKVGLLSAYYLLGFSSPGSFCLIMAWCTSVTAGHTKRVTTNAIFYVGYSLGNICATQFWKAQYKPRNYVPWAINLTSYTCSVTLILITRYVLRLENKRRDKLLAEGTREDEFGWVEREDENGKKYQQKVEKGFLDVTDRQNLAFRYCL